MPVLLLSNSGGAITRARRPGPQRREDPSHSTPGREGMHPARAGMLSTSDCPAPPYQAPTTTPRNGFAGRGRATRSVPNAPTTRPPVGPWGWEPAIDGRPHPGRAATHAVLAPSRRSRGPDPAPQCPGMPAAARGRRLPNSTMKHQGTALPCQDRPAATDRDPDCELRSTPRRSVRRSRRGESSTLESFPRRTSRPSLHAPTSCRGRCPSWECAVDHGLGPGIRHAAVPPGNSWRCVATQR